MKDKGSAQILGGQRDSAPEDGNAGLVEARNLRYDRGYPQRRGGIQRVARVPNHHSSQDFDGTNDFWDVPLYVALHTMKRLWTVEVLVNADTFATNERNILGAAHAADYSLRLYFTTAGKLEAKVQDSAGTVVTLTSTSTFLVDVTYAIQVVRDGTSLLLRVNNVLEDFDTMADLDGRTPGGNLQIGCNNSTNFFNGDIDFCRCLLVALSTQAYGKMRLPDPLAEYVAWDYCVDDAANSKVVDRSAYGNHATSSGSPAAGVVLTAQTHPVNGMRAWLDTDKRQRLFVAAGVQSHFQVMSR